MGSTNTRHILNLSGGKDSTALAVVMRERVPEMEYVFCDTDKELPETYEYLAKVEAFLGKPVVRLNADRGFDHWIQMYGGLIPSSQVRWCTRKLKLEPFERFVGEDPVVSYVAIRADENRSGYLTTKPNIHTVFPFKEMGVVKADVQRILDEAGLGMPAYYSWRSRSGCYFCFFQRRSEWVGLLENHPDLFQLAKTYEKQDPVTGRRFTWSPVESLDELQQPARMEEIRGRAKALDKETVRHGPIPLAMLVDDDDEDEIGCLMCHI